MRRINNIAQPYAGSAAQTPAAVLLLCTFLHRKPSLHPSLFPFWIMRHVYERRKLV